MRHETSRTKNLDEARSRYRNVENSSELTRVGEKKKHFISRATDNGEGSHTILSSRPSRMSLTALNGTEEALDQVEELMDRAVYISTAAALSTIAILGCCLNLIVILVILGDTQTLLTPVNVVLLNLVIGDFCVSILGSPFVVVSAIVGGWFWGHMGCIWYAWFMSTLGLASIGNLTVLAIERWLLITRPMKAFTNRQATYLVMGVWLYSLSLTIPPLCGWGSYGPEAGNLSCSVSWEVHDPATGSDSYIAFLFFFGLVVPVALISWSYLGIITTLKKVRKRVGSRGRHEARVTKMVAIMIIAFLTSWTPYSVLALSAQYLEMSPPPSIAILPSLLAKSSICYNPVIYAGMNSQFRNVLRNFLGLPDRTTTKSATVSPHTAVSGSNKAAFQVENN